MKYNMWRSGHLLLNPHTYSLSLPGKKCRIPLFCSLFTRWAESPGTSETGTRLLLMSLWITSGWASHWGRTLWTCEEQNTGFIPVVRVTRPPSVPINKPIYLLDRLVLKSSQNCEPSRRRSLSCGLFRCVIFCLCFLFFSSCVLLFIFSRHISVYNQKTDKPNHLRDIFVMHLGLTLKKLQSLWWLI